MRFLEPDGAHLPSFEQAACAPISGVTALQGLRDKGQIQAGQKILINGAAGGVGTFAVQIAKSFAADVTGVCSAKNVELVRGLGADRVVDYTREDFTTGTQRYDLILDCAGNRPLSASRRVMNPKGKYIVVGGPDGRWVGGLSLGLKAIMLSPLVSQDLVMFLANVNQKDLNVLREFMKSGKVTPVIDSCYPLSEVPAAIRHLEEGHARGKIVISVADR
jgi:NADPH:quinone reductase-like Zn-dependent oxidoreductase